MHSLAQYAFRKEQIVMTTFIMISLVPLDLFENKFIEQPITILLRSSWNLSLSNVKYAGYPITFYNITTKPASQLNSEGRLRTNLCDIRDDFTFPIVNVPFICSNLLAAYSRDCGSYHDFVDRVLLLTRKLPNQGIRTFYCRHHDLVNCYGISVSRKPTKKSCLS